MEYPISGISYRSQSHLKLNLTPTAYVTRRVVKAMVAVTPQIEPHSDFRHRSGVGSRWSQSHLKLNLTPTAFFQCAENEPIVARKKAKRCKFVHIIILTKVFKGLCRAVFSCMLRLKIHDVFRLSKNLFMLFFSLHTWLFLRFLPYGCRAALLRNAATATVPRSRG